MDGFLDGIVEIYGHNEVGLGSLMLKMVPLYRNRDVEKRLLKKKIMESHNYRYCMIDLRCK